MSIFNRIAAIVAGLTGSTPAAIAPDLNLVDDLGVDSLSKCELALALERAFDLLINDAEVEGMQTVGDVAEVVSRRLAPELAGA